MSDSTRKKLLDAALNTLLAAIDTAWWAKGPATLISELSARFGDLPDEQKVALAGATPEALRQALTQLDLATKNAAYAAAGVDRIEDCMHRLFEAIQVLLSQSQPPVSQGHDVQGQQQAVGDLDTGYTCAPRSSPPLKPPDPMTTDLSTRIEYLLRRSHEWASWSTALRAAHAIGQYRRTHTPCHVYSHVDTSEVIEYVLPGVRTPMQVRVSLELLFASSGFPLYLLPSHAQELRGALVALRQKDCAFLQSTRALNNTVQSILRSSLSKLKERPTAEFCESVAKLITDNVPPIEALEVDRSLNAWSALTDLFESRRLRFQTADALPIDGTYVPDADHYPACLLALRTQRPDDVVERRNQVDASAIDYLRWLNEALPNGHVAILYTRTRSMLAAIEEFCRSDPAYLTKHGIPLVQTPDSALMYFGFFGIWKHPESTLLRNELALARANSAEETRARLNKLRHWHQHGYPVSADYVHDLEDRFLATTRTFDRLVQVALNTMLVNPEHRRNRLYEFLTSHDIDVDPLALLESFEKLLDECIDAGEATRSRLYLSVVPDISWDDMRVESRAESMLLGPLHAVGVPPTNYVFQSAAMTKLLERFEGLRHAEGPSQPHAMRSELIEHEVKLKNEPEFYLLLSFIFSMCRDMWLQAYDAAEHGLRTLFPPDGVAPNESDADSIGNRQLVTACELWLAEATALGRWGLQQRTHATLCTLFMSRAAERLEQCLAPRPA